MRDLNMNTSFAYGILNHLAFTFSADFILVLEKQTEFPSLKKTEKFRFIVSDISESEKIALWIFFLLSNIFQSG